MSKTKYCTTTDLISGGWASDLVVGKRIASVDTTKSTLTLDDGTLLEFIHDQECCSWYGPRGMKVFPFEDNIITDIREVRVDSDECGSLDVYEIVFLHENKELANVKIEGNMSNGYYLTVGSLMIVLPE